MPVLRSLRQPLFGVFVACMLVGLFMIATHTMWRDEILAWQIVAAGTNLADLARNIKYETHPWLWYIFILFFKQFWANPNLMKVLNFAFGSLTIYLICLRSPFNRLEKIFLSLGYFFIFENLVIARNYSLSAMFLFLIASLRPLHSRPSSGRILFVGLALACFANSTAQSAVASLPFALYLLAISLKPYWRESKRTRAAFLGACAIAATGIAFAVFTLARAAKASSYPTLDSHAAVHVFSSWPDFEKKFSLLASRVLEVFVPIPKWQLEFWNTSLVTTLNDFVVIGFFIFACGFSILAVRETRWLRLVYASTLGLILAVMFTSPNIGVLRHYEIVFVIFLFFLWLSREGEPTIESRWIRRGCLLLFTVQAVAGIEATILASRATFSTSSDAAEFIRSVDPEGTLPIFGSSDFSTAAVAGFLGRKFNTFYNEGPVAFVLADEKRQIFPPKVGGVELVRKKVDEILKHSDGVFIILNNSYENLKEQYEPYLDHACTWVSTTRSVISDEHNTVVLVGGSDSMKKRCEPLAGYH